MTGSGPGTGLPAGFALPDAADIDATAVVVSLPMRTRFRVSPRVRSCCSGDRRVGSEFAPFTEYDDTESAAWLAAGSRPPISGRRPRRDRVPVNATVPAVPADQVAAILARYPGATTAKVKVAEPGQSLDDDVARVAAARSGAVGAHRRRRTEGRCGRR